MNVHRVRFIEHQPKSIHCLAFSDDRDGPPRLAVARGDASLEIWNSSSDEGVSYHQALWVPGREDSSVEALAWCQGRLFSAGLTGSAMKLICCEFRCCRSLCVCVCVCILMYLQ